ncbi:unnamed protein product [Meganyctiphanes norvegica]|uniref:Uncharacterized protein n=1 Tax=Meganyctiphanes norvegica TaxID=48144 RepID=A0AAV2QDV7_MEGNR
MLGKLDCDLFTLNEKPYYSVMGKTAKNKEVKPKRNRITFETKAKIIKLKDEGKKNSELCKMFFYHHQLFLQFIMPNLKLLCKGPWRNAFHKGLVCLILNLGLQF